jgi:uncharacterized protein (TIGR02466 family)
MSNIIHPFQIPIYQSSIDEDSFIQIKEDVNNFIENKKELFTSTWDCPTLTTFSIHKTNISLIKSLNPTLISQIQSHTNQYFNQWGFENVPEVRIDDLWINISPPNSYQEVHHHGSYLFSGVIYINVDKDSGDFWFINPLASEAILLRNPTIFGRSYNITPNNSSITIFPSWMQHRVSQNKSNINRISISFNIKSNFE